MDDHVVAALWRAFDARDWARALGLLSRVLLTDGNDIVHAVSLYRLRDGQITEAVEVFAESGEPPHDRSRWAERYELKVPAG